jgi:hypothetical protein
VRSGEVEDCGEGNVGEDDEERRLDYG